ncbi:hypothetical protein ASC77_15945 [Nocardioides sp. Root1257]|uniref:PQQ-binding-like beta-propeller repeat protein n=1 Tax=unclassified Nocardioides TaxID=2615069 RepID=UPI0006FF28A6|nr:MULTISPECIES: PQQ-binding-like beta-propeller repeat protein [unclassified Nocardioides]KQW47903.1 hypothetical protein ASC77_15945 [Nocardioides sp. Root1257]KRC45155.1 hypothetical protein ASE24_16895 [Nocardioides sp. Root224]
MRFGRTLALLGVAVLWFGFGPLVLVVAGLSLLWPPLRAWLRPTRRVVAVWAAVVVVLAGLAVVVPDGWVPIPPGPGRWVTPAYVGRPSVAGPVRGPVGESPTVTTRSYGVSDCARIELDDDGRLVLLCGGDRPVLRVVDPDSLRQERSADLPGSGCAGQLAVDGDDVVASSGQRIFRLGVDDLVVESSVDLSGDLGDDDCVAGLGVDPTGRVWFASGAGVVGFVAGRKARTVDLADRVERPVTVSDDGVFVAGADALHRVDVAAGSPTPAWAAAYDDGGERGSAPVVLPDGLVAVADNRDPRLEVVLHRADTGEVVCRTEVFDDDEGATDGGLVAAGTGVVVANSHGYGGVASTVLGRTTSRGIARVDVVDGRCRVTWTTDMDAPSGAPAVSTEDGFAYVWTKRHSWLGVDAWYLSALDLRTGRLAWARRTGLNPLVDNHGGSVVLGADRSAYVPVLGGLVRVADREVGG